MLSSHDQWYHGWLSYIMRAFQKEVEKKLLAWVAVANTVSQNTCISVNILVLQLAFFISSADTGNRLDKYISLSCPKHLPQECMTPDKVTKCFCTSHIFPYTRHHILSAIHCGPHFHLLLTLDVMLMYYWLHVLTTIDFRLHVELPLTLDFMCYLLLTLDFMLYC